MQFISRRIAIEFRQPEFLSMRRRSIFPVFVSMPENKGWKGWMQSGIFFCVPRKIRQLVSELQAGETNSQCDS